LATYCSRTQENQLFDIISKLLRLIETLKTTNLPRQATGDKGGKKNTNGGTHVEPADSPDFYETCVQRLLTSGMTSIPAYVHSKSTRTEETLKARFAVSLSLSLLLLLVVVLLQNSTTTPSSSTAEL
jgi:hypothetical protein